MLSVGALIPPDFFLPGQESKKSGSKTKTTSLERRAENPFGIDRWGKAYLSLVQPSGTSFSMGHDDQIREQHPYMQARSAFGDCESLL